jgi:hypothetical protein
MTFAVHPPRAASVDVLGAFQLRCWARAWLFAEGELDLHDAVDELQLSAARDGLVAAIGHDAVQDLIGNAFGAVRRKPTAWDLGEAFSDHRGVLDAQTIADLASIIRRNDPQQFQNWIARLSVAERQAVGDLVAA